MSSLCLHCGASALPSSEFCCNGCKAAYSLVNSLGLKRFYATRATEAGSLKPDEQLVQTDISRFAIRDAEGNFTLNLMVQGLQCAACVWLIESTLGQQADVLQARVNMTTRRMVLRWRGAASYGNELAHLVAQLGYRLVPYDAVLLNDTSLREQKFLLRCLGIAGFASSNLMLLSAAVWSGGAGMGETTRDLFYWVSVLIGLPAILYAGQPFYRSAIRALKSRRTNMDVPISLAVLLASAMSLWQTAIHGTEIYFESAAMLLFFLLAGRYLDRRARSRARGAAQDMLTLLASSATVLEGGRQRSLPVSEVREGMEVLVAAGEKLPVDGEVIEGESELDTSLLTGETLPKQAIRGTRVFAGTLNLSAPLKLRVTGVGEGSLLAEMVRLMEQAEQGRAGYVRLADRAARLYTPVIHSIALLTFLGHLALGTGWEQALTIAIAVLIITCPCALGLAVPAVQVLATGRLLRSGILLKSGAALERLARIRHVVFDKTGTLTEGMAELVGGDYTPDDLALAASLAVHSRHPLARALCRAYAGELLSLSVKEVPGSGLQAAEIKLGKKVWVADNPQSTINLQPELWLTRPGKAPAHFTFTDKLREDAAEVVAELKRQGLGVTLLSGDRTEVVEQVANTVGIADRHALMLPADKAARLAEIPNALMVGDGLNDAAALAAASVSMSPSSAMDLTQNAADIVFQGRKLYPVLEARRVALFADRLVKQNFTFAVVYNIIAIPLAAAGYVNPLIAAVAMSFSSITVVLNALRLNRKTL